MSNLVSTNNVLERIEELCNEPLYAGLNYDILNIIEEHREKCAMLEQVPLTDSQIATRVRQIYLETIEDLPNAKSCTERDNYKKLIFCTGMLLGKTPEEIKQQMNSISKDNTTNE